MTRVQNRIDFTLLKSNVSLESLAARAGVTLRKSQRSMTGLCPFHTESTPSFNIYKGKDGERFKCYGCGETGDAIDFVSKIYRVDLIEAVKIVGGEVAAPFIPRQQQTHLKVKDNLTEVDKARKLYFEAAPATGSPVETYLRSRKIRVERIGDALTGLRFSMIDYWHPRPGSDEREKLGRFPAMLAPIQDAGGRVTAVHITYLDPVTFGKLQMPDPFRRDRMLARKKIRGDKMGGCIRLGPASPHMMIAEGIETALSIRAEISRTRLDQPVWTFVDLGNLQNITVPDVVNRLMILADNDMKMPTADRPRDLRQFIKDTAAAISRTRKDLSVRVAWPPLGMDFNDWVQEIDGRRS